MIKKFMPLVLYVTALIFFAAAFTQEGYDYMTIGLLFLILGNQENSPDVRERTKK